MRRPLVVLVLLAVAGCGAPTTSSAPSSTVVSNVTTGGSSEPGCSSFAGKPATAATFADPCVVDAATADMLDLPVGEKFYAGTGRTLCEDGRVLIWNDLGWGYEGAPFTGFSEGGIEGEYVAPQADRDGCAA